MNYKNISNDELLSLVKTKSRDERALTLEVIQLIREVESRKLFLARGYSSLFDFVTQELGYEPTAALTRIQTARTIREIPEVEKKVSEGALTLTVISQAQTFFRKEAKLQNKKLTTFEKVEVLKKLENKSSRDAQKMLLELSPQQVSLTETIKVLTSMHIVVRMVVRVELEEKIQKFKTHFSHVDPHMTHAELFEKLADMALTKMTAPSHRARDVASPAKTNTRRIPAHVKRLIYSRDKGCCTYRDKKTGRVCGSKFQVQCDHIIPFALGGLTTLENLRLLCGAHNRYRSEQVFGRVV